MIRTLSGKPANPRPISLYQRAKAVLSNRGVYLRGVSVNGGGGLTVSNVLDAIARYEGRPRPKVTDLELGNRQIEAWLEKHDSAPASEQPDAVPMRPLKLSREMKAQMARCAEERAGKGL